jgi:anaerobic selenocysteine-containing dehydrogenase
MASLDVVERSGACPLDCPDTCSLSVTVEGGRVTKLDGSRDNPLTAGFICGKVRHFPELVYGKDRVRYPAVRVGPKGSGQFRRVSWDEAFETIVARFESIRAQHGGEAILPLSYGGSNGWVTHNALDMRLFYRVGASRLARTLCAAATTTAATGLYGKMGGVAYEDYPSARLIVIWGCNPSVSGIHLVPFVRRAQEAGARLVVVDPRATPLARRADLHLALRPGTDLPVALALIRELFENGRADLAFLREHARNWESLRERAAPWNLARAADVAGVPIEQLKTFTRLYADTEPALVRCGWGPERSRNGGSAIAAILALPAVAGKFGVRGGGFTMSNSAAWDVDATAAICEPPPNTRVINMNRVGETLAPGFAPPVRGVFVYNCNPLATFPAQNKVRAGFERDDLFTVVHEQVMTDTARYADVLLPATTFLEHEEVKRGYGATLAMWSKPAIDPVGEARPNYWVFAELCRRMGVARPSEPESPAEIMRAIVATSSEARRIVSELESTGQSLPPSGPRPVQFVDVFPRTADGKIDLVPASLDAEAPRGLYGYLADPGSEEFPLALISPSTSSAISSTLYQRVEKQVPLEMHSRDAACRGVTDGDAVRVFNALGEIRCTVHVNDEVREGVVALPKGLWAKHTANGQTANAVSPDTLTDIGGGACFNDARVEVCRA